MVASKKTEILGTKSLNQCDSIRLYNTETFKNPSIVSGFGLSESDVELLCSTPDATKVVEINTILSRFTEYDALEPDENLVFTFNNNVPGLLNGQGFEDRRKDRQSSRRVSNRERRRRQEPDLARHKGIFRHRQQLGEDAGCDRG